MAFEGDIVVRQVDAKIWELVEPVRYQGNTDRFEVPVGFRTDFASVPRIFVWLLPRYGVYTKSAILHDSLCRQEGFSRSDADGIFRRSMRELEVPFVRRWMMWAAVRAGSKLKGAGPGQALVWLLAALPSLVFVVLPALLILVWLGLFWLVELVFFVVLRPFSRKPVTMPEPMLNTA